MNLILTYIGLFFFMFMQLVCLCTQCINEILATLNVQHKIYVKCTYSSAHLTIQSKVKINESMNGVKNFPTWLSNDNFLYLFDRFRTNNCSNNTWRFKPSLDCHRNSFRQKTIWLQVSWKRDPLLVVFRYVWYFLIKNLNFLKFPTISFILLSKYTEINKIWIDFLIRRKSVYSLTYK